MPAEKRKKTKTPEDVPDMGDPDRKRVLNVLAQRRYRQRRREKIAALEAQAKSQSPPQLQTTARLHDSPIEPESVDTTGTTILPTDSTSEESEPFEEILRPAEDMAFPTLPMVGFNQHSLDLNFFQEFGISSLPSPLPSTPESLDPQPSQLCIVPSATFDFPLTSDGGNLPIPMLSALRAFGTIATMLDVTSHLWNPFYLHTLPSTPHPALPPNLHPTPSQVTIPHHPVIDILPWPSVREKLICMFAMPSALRPPIAQDDEKDGQGKAVMRLVQDLDDFQEGVRVHGNMAGWGDENEMVEEAWEVGELLYRNWWWCLDSGIIEIANKRRKERGLGALRMKT